jgi:hypothetical protein
MRRQLAIDGVALCGGLTDSDTARVATASGVRSRIVLPLTLIVMAHRELMSPFASVEHRSNAKWLCRRRLSS